MSDRVVAVDLGASSGRVFAADIDASHLALSEVARFPNSPVRIGPLLHWDILGLYRGVLDGLAAAGHSCSLASVGLDSWAVDYGLLRANGTLAGNPISHRDPRTQAAFDELVPALGVAEIYRRTGIALLPMNTLYQLATDARNASLVGAWKALLIPDLLAYFLTGQLGSEETNASTTQLLGLDGQWDSGLLRAAAIPQGLLAPVIKPGTHIGEIDRATLAELGLHGPVPVTAVASHDTASAVVAVPASGPGFAYISCGTWSLVGVELEQPVITEAARRGAFTNERGIDGTTRLLRNVMGLWLLQQSVRTWELHGERIDLARLNEAARELPAGTSVIDPNSMEYLTPGDMPERIAADCRRRGQPVPLTPPEFTRCILDSLALAYRGAVRQAVQLSGRPVTVIHLVGGGVNNHLLCQLTADASGLPVIAGPVEAAAIGNALVQARAVGLIDGDRWALRRFVAAHAVVERYEPQQAMTKRFADISSST